MGPDLNIREGGACMKIEKINENQIRCVLTRDDLNERQLKLSELAYGTSKAKQLFQDMMQQAAFQYGFDVENIPLMIEAIPLSGESIVIVVTKVANPEELDTRFSSFTPAVEEMPGSDEDNGPSSAIDQLIESIRRTPAAEQAENAASGAAASQTRGSEKNVSAARRAEYMKLREYIMMHRLYAFDSLDGAVNAARQTAGLFRGKSDLLQDPQSRQYYLFLTMKDMEEVSAMQNVLAAVSEYGRPQLASFAREQHLSEHFRLLIAENALQELARI